MGTKYGIRTASALAKDVIAATKKGGKGLKECAICGEKRAVDRCHIYPARVVKRMAWVGFNKAEKLKYKGNHIMLLCKNHHWLYDHNGLQKEEFDKIKDFVVTGWQEWLRIIAMHREKGYWDSDLVKTIKQWSDGIESYIQKTYGK